MRVICVAGARPNFMKVKPVMDALEEQEIEVIGVHTGQHYDPAMSDVFFAELGIRRPDYFLGAGSGTHAVQICRVMTAFEPLAARLAPDVVVVVGDVNSTLACALVTAKLGASLAHVEAGLRSGDRSMPEEINRVVTDRVSDYLFAPSADAVANLRAEGFPDEQVYLVGNVMVDTLLANVGRATAGGTLAGLGAAGPDRFRRVQEETTVLGVPCLTLRDSTERPVTVIEGTNRLVRRDPGRIVEAAREVLAAPLPGPRTTALWDGKAGRRIAAALVAAQEPDRYMGKENLGDCQGSDPPAAGRAPALAVAATGSVSRLGAVLGTELRSRRDERTGFVRSPGRGQGRVPQRLRPGARRHVSHRVRL